AELRTPRARAGRFMRRGERNSPSPALTLSLIGFVRRRVGRRRWERTKETWNGNWDHSSGGGRDRDRRRGPVGCPAARLQDGAQERGGQGGADNRRRCRAQEGQDPRPLSRGVLEQVVRLRGVPERRQGRACGGGRLRQGRGL